MTHTFGLPLQEASLPRAERGQKPKPLAAVSLAEDQLLAARQQSHQQAETSHTPPDEDESAALLARLRFSKSFLQV